MSAERSYERFLDRLEGLTIEDEEGQFRLFSGLPGLTPEEITALESKSGYKLPGDFKLFSSRWDGVELGPMELLPHPAWFMIESGLIAIHPWGNGDFDCIELKKENYGAVVFLSRESAKRPVVASSFSEWIMRAVKELEHHGKLFHPIIDSEPGFYRKALSHQVQRTAVRVEEPGNWIYWICSKLFHIRHGRLLWHHRSGGKKREVVYRFGKQKRERCWDENGAMTLETFFISEDVANGTQTAWHPNGRVKSRREFVRGHLHGKETLWDEHGAQTAERVWEWNKLMSEAAFNRYTNTIEETVYNYTEGKRAVTEIRKRKMQ